MTVRYVRGPAAVIPWRAMLTIRTCERDEALRYASELHTRIVAARGLVTYSPDDPSVVLEAVKAVLTEGDR